MSGLFHRLPESPHVRVVSVAGRAEPVVFRAGVERLLARGLRVSLDRVLLGGSHPYLASDDAQRAEDLVEAFLDPAVDAVICARGGYGAMRLLDRVDFRQLAKSGKAFVGFSDITALHLALNAAGLCTVHGPVVTGLGRAAPVDASDAVDLLLDLLRDPGRERALPGEALAAGEAEGPLVGGNLSLLASCLPIRGRCPLPVGAILLVEEVNEPLYRLDRLLTGLLLAGLLDEVAGIALGSFVGCGQGADGPREACEVAAERLSRLGVPMVGGLPIGHAEADVPVLLGAPVALDGAVGLLSWTARERVLERVSG